jgi:hypothetical protein
MIEGQINQTQQPFLASAILKAPQKPGVLFEADTWLGGSWECWLLRTPLAMRCASFSRH